MNSHNADKADLEIRGPTSAFNCPEAAIRTQGGKGAISSLSSEELIFEPPKGWVWARFMIKATPRVKGLDDLTVAAFGPQIGMRDHGRFPALVTSGHTSATRKQNPITGLTQLYMTEADIAVFHERYFTLPTMAREYGIDRRALLTRLKSSEIRPFKPNDQDYGHLYLRKDVDAFLK
jgi:hypothetical protein